MNQTADALTFSERFNRGEPVYRVVLSVDDPQRATCDVRAVVERVRGDLRRVSHREQHRRVRLSLQLGVRRIDDVVTGLEAAGFDIAAVVATHQHLETAS